MMSTQPKNTSNSAAITAAVAVVMTETARTNNRASNYTPAINMEILNRIKATGNIKLPSADSVWTTMAKDLSRKSSALFSHWNDMISHMRCARSNLKRSFPDPSASSASSETDTYESKCQKFYQDLLAFMVQNPKLCGSKSGWDLALVTALCDMQLAHDKLHGLDEIQSATTLTETADKMQNKFCAETLIKRASIAKMKDIEDSERKKNNDFREGMLDSIKALTSAISTPLTGVPSAQPPNQETEAISQLKARVNTIDTKIVEVNDKVDQVLQLLRAQGSRKRGREDDD